VQPDAGAVQSVKLAFAISDIDSQVNENLFAVNGKAQGAWTPAAPGQFSALATANFGPGNDIMLVGLGLDHQIYGARFRSDGNLAFGWFLVAPGQFSTVVAVTVGTPGAGSFPMVFGMGIDGQVYGARLSGEGLLLNGFFLVAPGQFHALSASQFGAGNPELFGIGIDRQVYAARFDTNGNFQNGWFLIAPGQFTSTAATTLSNGGVELLGIGADQKIYGAALDANGVLASGWFNTAPGTFTSVTAVTPSVADLTGAFGVYALGTDHQIYKGTFDAKGGGIAESWFLTAPGLFSSLAAGVNLMDRAEVLGIGLDSQIYGELFSPTNAFLDGFFTTSAGKFRAVTLAA
jgi:hypothetical protein